MSSTRAVSAVDPSSNVRAQLLAPGPEAPADPFKRVERGIALEGDPHRDDGEMA
jgi:hypothetical protein